MGTTEAKHVEAKNATDSHQTAANSFLSKILYYLGHPLAFAHRLRQLVIGDVSLGFFLRNVCFYRPATLLRRVSKWPGVRHLLTIVYYLSHPLAFAHRLRQLVIGDVSLGFFLRNVCFYRPATLLRRVSKWPGVRHLLTIVYYLSHPSAFGHRLRQRTIGYVNWRYAHRRLASYMTRPQAAMRRIFKINIGEKSVARVFQGIGYYAKRPKLALIRMLGLTPPPPPPPPPPVQAPQLEPGAPSASDRSTAIAIAGEDIAKQWFNEGIAYWAQSEPTDSIVDAAERLEQASNKLEKAMAILDDPAIVIHLAAMMIKMDRNDEALALYQKAFRKHPEHRELWYHAGVHLLRHGEYKDIMDFYDGVLIMEPDHQFAKFVKTIYSQFPVYANTLVTAVGKNSDKTPPSRKFLITCAAWGKEYVESFLQYTLAALLSEQNIPAMAEDYDIHIVVFTVEADLENFKKHLLYKRALEHCKFHFICYDAYLIGCSQSPDDEIANPCKFALMSCSHYVALECGRRLDADVFLMAADNIVNASFLSNAKDILARDVSVIACPGYRLHRKPVLAEVEKRYRQKNGTIKISSAEFSRVLFKFMPEEFFVESEKFTRFPLFLCWRVKDEGMIIHANHYMPYVIRARQLKKPLTLSIDPVDGRFLDRNLISFVRMHLVNNADICVFDAAEDPMVEASLFKKNKFQHSDVALWLWCYWDRLRSKFFQESIRYPLNGVSSAWDAVEETAAGDVNRILSSMSYLENKNLSRPSWRLEDR